MEKRRRYPRIKIPPKFKIKARIRPMGETRTHYLEVNNLSLGGVGLFSKKMISLNLQRGDVLEVLLVGGELSLKCVAKLVQVDYIETNPQMNQVNSVQAGIEIVGIDEKSRTILVDFLKRVSDNFNPTMSETDPTIS